MSEFSKDNTNDSSSSNSERSRAKRFSAFQTDRQKTLLTVLIIFLIALAIRFVYLYQSRDNPSFDVPIVDSAKYDMLARTLVKTGRIDDEFFWQPLFYPVFLAVVYWFSNGSIVAAKIVQAILGAVTCCMTFYLGKMVFNRRCGVIAGVILCFYGPLIFFEQELLATGWATFWAVVLLILFIKSSQSTKLWFFFSSWPGRFCKHNNQTDVSSFLCFRVFLACFQSLPGFFKSLAKVVCCRRYSVGIFFNFGAGDIFSRTTQRGLFAAALFRRYQPLHREQSRYVHHTNCPTQ
jgi:hypothetical protein